MGASTSAVYDRVPMVGKTVIITGGNSGVGFCAARDLARLGATVVITARDEARGRAALEELQRAVPDGKLGLELLDLTRLESVRQFAHRWGAIRSSAGSGAGAIDVLINNAGIMMTPTRELSADGFELQLATNHLGHFALTGLLLPFLRQAPAPRIVNVSSVLARDGRPGDPVDFRKDAGYSAYDTYCESKLVNLLFTLELSKRLPPSVLCLSAHPGVSATNLFKHKYSWAKPFMQSADMGAQSLVRAAVDASAQAMWYFGPNGNRGAPQANLPKPAPARDEAAAARYWAASEEATGVSFPSEAA